MSSKEEISGVIAGTLGVGPSEVASSLVAPPEPALGDYALPCFPFAGRLGKSPNAIARDLEARLAGHPCIEKASAAGPYLNIRVKAEMLAREVLSGIVQAVASGRPYASTTEGAGKTVVIEYSSPNIAKPFGIGHLRSTVIGNALARLYSVAGWRVVRLNYLGDWGTQFGLLLVACRRWSLSEDALKNSPSEEEAVKHLVELYQRANAEAKADPNFAESARAAFKALESGDSESRRLWECFRNLSLEAFQKIYNKLGVSFDSFDGEASTQPSIPKAIEELRRRNLLKESQGAQVVELGLGEGVPPAMILKSDGATTYLARDLAAVLDRWDKYRFDRCIYVVGRDQELHFKQLFRVLELMGLDWAGRCIHVPFGMIRFGGEKMRTRAGTSILLEDVFARAFEEVGRIVQTRKKDADLDDTAQRQADEAVALGAMIFADLSRRRIKDFDFDWKTAFSLDGDSGPYLQYAHARSAGILRKAARTPPHDVQFGLLASPAERELIGALGRYPDAVLRAREANEPSILATALLEVAGALNKFYNTCRVLGEPRAVEDARLLLVWAAKTVLAEGLDLLGIKAPEAI